MRKVLLAIMFISLFSCLGFSQEAKYYLSSHILDIDKGKPASDVKIMLSRLDDGNHWVELDSLYTDNNGRVKTFLKEKEGFNPIGTYKLTYFVKPYFDKQGKPSFYPYIEVVFNISDKTHYHVPITLSAHGYSTYRGS